MAKQACSDKSAALVAIQKAHTAYFDLVSPAKNTGGHWKDPINAIVGIPEGFNPHDLASSIEAAVMFLTGCAAKIEYYNEGTRITALKVTGAGYFATIGA